MNMKRFFALALALALLVLCGCGRAKTEPEPTEAPAAEPTGAPAAEPTEAPEAEPTPDPEELYKAAMARMDRAWKSVEPDTVVCTIDGEAVTWDTYFYLLSDELMTMLYYTGTLPESFDQQLTEDRTMEQYLRDMALAKAEYYTLAHTRAAAAGVTLSQEKEQELADYWTDLTEQYGGEDALQESLEGNFLTRDVFERLLRCSEELGAMVEELYGVNGGKLTPEEVLAWAAEDEYIRVKHVLYFFYDDAGLPLDEDGKAGQLARAEATLEELKALLDDPEALEARFDEIMNADSGDAGGLSRFPEGYTFTSGTMYPEFEEAAFALEEYGLSDIIESQSGYHIILRLPLDPDGATMDQDSNTGDYLTLRASAAADMFGKQMAEWIKAARVEWAEGYEDLDLDVLFAE